MPPVTNPPSQPLVRFFLLAFSLLDEFTSTPTPEGEQVPDKDRKPIDYPAKNKTR